MDTSKEDVLKGVSDLESKTVTLDLAFLFNTFLREGSEINFKVIKGLPEGAKALAAGIFDDALVVVFDVPVPSEIWFEDRDKGVEISKAELN